MATGRMKYTMAFRHPETLEVHALLVGEEVPSWAKDLVHEGDVEPEKAPARRSSAKSE